MLKLEGTVLCSTALPWRGCLSGTNPPSGYREAGPKAGGSRWSPGRRALPSTRGRLHHRCAWRVGDRFHVVDSGRPLGCLRTSETQ